MKFPVSFHQQRLCLIDKFGSDTINKSAPIYLNIPFVVKVKGNLNLTTLEKSMNIVLSRNEILRTNFHFEKDTIYQVVNNEFKLEFNFVDIHSNELSNDDIKTLIFNEVKRPFSISEELLFRSKILKTGTSDFIFLFTSHHLVMDRYSFRIFYDDVLSCYIDIENGKDTSIAKNILHYADYSNWQSEITKRILKDYSIFCKNRAKDYDHNFKFPLDQVKETSLKCQNKYEKFNISEGISSMIETFCENNKIEKSLFFLSIYYILLSKYGQSSDVIIGFLKNNRDNEKLNSLIGPVSNIIPIVARVIGENTFENIISNVIKLVEEVDPYKNLPYEKTVIELFDGTNREVDFLFNYENDYNFPEIENLICSEIETNLGLGKYDLNLLIKQTKSFFSGVICYNSNHINEESVKRIIESYKLILVDVLNDPKKLVRDIEWFSKENIENLLLNFNDTDAKYNKEISIIDLFEDQVLKFPDKIALIFNDQTISYKELNSRTNKLARLLRKKGVTRNTIVGISMERSIDMILGILSILKAGGAYLPVDVDCPKERFKYIVENSAIQFLLVSGNNIFNFTSLNIKEGEIYKEENNTNLNKINSSSDVAYAIYTSGSSGHPKGVIIEHHSLINYSVWASKTYINSEKVNFPLYTSISFDLTVTSIFAPLISGNIIIIYRDDDKNLSFEKVIMDNQVDIIKLTPSHLKLLKENRFVASNQNKLKLKKLIVGGEELTTQLSKEIHEVLKGNVEIFNEYGPTEATVGCMIYKYDYYKDKRYSVPIGLPIDNTQIYLFDKYLKPVPIGVTGEIYISGEGVGRGYLFKPELSHNAFISNPFVDGKIMYKTGDLARRLSDGNLLYLGRLDKQNKIRGNRIELGEIENILLKHNKISDATVLVKEENNEQYICGFIVKNRDLSINEIRNYLRSYLPEYMIPSSYIFLDEFPVTPNGKIDEKKLKELNNYETLENILVSPSTDIEIKVASCWKKVLNKKEIGIYDNYFEAGGNSLSLIRLETEIKKILNSDISYIDLFKHPTIDSFVKFISNKGVKIDITEEELDNTVEQLDNAINLLKG